MSLLCAIKLHQLPFGSMERKLRRDDIILDKEMIEPIDPDIDF
jgi:hypothetical protein